MPRPGNELHLPLSVLGTVTSTVCQLVEEALQGERQERCDVISDREEDGLRAILSRVVCIHSE